MVLNLVSENLVASVECVVNIGENLVDFKMYKPRLDSASRQSELNLNQ